MQISKLYAYLTVCVLSLGFQPFTAEVMAQTRVRISYMPIAEETPRFVAKEKGFFTKHGLDVEMVRFESGPDAVTALLGGSIQIAIIAAPSLINAAIAGRPLVAIADNGSNTVGPGGFEYYAGLVVLDESPIRDLGDLKGKKVAFNVLKANSEIQTVMQLLRWNREHPDRTIDVNKDVRLMTLPFGSMPAALEKGLVDAASMIEPYMTQLSLKRKVRLIAPVSYALPNYPVSFVITRRDYAESNVEILRKFLAAWSDSVQWIRQNPVEARTILQKYTGVPTEIAARIVLPAWSDNIKGTLRNTERVMEGMLAGGMISKKVNLPEMIIDDLSLLDKKKK